MSLNYFERASGIAFARGVVLFAATALAALFVGCQTTDDPREGGFLSGVHSLSTDAYERRVQEREARLRSLQETQSRLEEERGQLESRQQQSLSAHARERGRLDALARDTELLRKRVLELKATGSDQDARRVELTRRLDALQKKLEELAEQPVSTPDLSQDLIRERDVLEREYRLLLDIYRELSQ